MLFAVAAVLGCNLVREYTAAHASEWAGTVRFAALLTISPWIDGAALTVDYSASVCLFASVQQPVHTADHPTYAPLTHVGTSSFVTVLKPIPSDQRRSQPEQTVEFIVSLKSGCGVEQVNSFRPDVRCEAFATPPSPPLPTPPPNPRSPPNSPPPPPFPLAPLSGCAFLGAYRAESPLLETDNIPATLQLMWWTGGTVIHLGYFGCDVLNLRTVSGASLMQLDSSELLLLVRCRDANRACRIHTL